MISFRKRQRVPFVLTWLPTPPPPSLFKKNEGGGGGGNWIIKKNLITQPSFVLSNKIQEIPLNNQERDQGLSLC